MPQEQKAIYYFSAAGGRAAVLLCRKTQATVFLDQPDQIYDFTSEIQARAWLAGRAYQSLPEHSKAAPTSLIFSDEQIWQINQRLIGLPSEARDDPHKQFFGPAHALAEVIISQRLELSLIPPSPALQSLDYGSLSVRKGDQSVSIPFDDEYGDAERGNMLAVFNLALLECENYDDSTDILNWAQTMALDVADQNVRALFDALAAASSWLKAHAPAAKSAASDFDVEMGNGYIEAVRAIQL